MRGRITIPPPYRYRQIKPNESLSFHASNNHLSNWLAARGEFELASKFRALNIDDFKNVEDRRSFHLKLIDDSINQDKDPIIVEHSLNNIEQIHPFKNS